MPYIAFNNNGYDYCADDNAVLFSETHAHNALFDYVTTDLSCLPELFDQYVAEIIDTNTLELKKSHAHSHAHEEIKNKLEQSHPYFKYEYKKIMTNEIGNYFNALLVYLSVNKNGIPIERTLEKEWYIDKITRLIPYSLLPDGTNHIDFYHKYQKQVGPHVDSEIDFLIPNVPRNEPHGFLDEIHTQKAIYGMLYFILDINAQGINELTSSQRIWLYRNIYYTTYVHPIGHVTKRLLFQSPKRLHANEDKSHESAHNLNIENVFKPLHGIASLNAGFNSIPENMVDQFNLAIEYAKDFTMPIVNDEYLIDNLGQILYLEIMSMIQSGTMIRKCRNCGKYFVVNNRKIAYCNRNYADGKTCSAVGSIKTFQKKLEKEKELELYNRAYKTHYARRKKGTMTQDEFEVWCTHAKEKLEEVRTGKLDISIYQEWLKK